MPDCEMCGREVDSVCRCIVEGSILYVCSLCSKFGVVLAVPAQKPNVQGPQIISPRIYSERQTGQPDEIDLIVKDYGEKIRKARERKGLTQEELAKALAEKESVIQKVENNQAKPTLLLAKKLQQFLGVELIEKYEEEKPVVNFKNAKKLTIGDLLEIEKAKKNSQEKE